MQTYITFLSHHPFLIAGMISAAVILLILEAWRIRKTMRGLPSTQAIHLINHENAAIIDIRPKDMFNIGHIVHAESIEPKEMTTNKRLNKLKSKPLLIVCIDGRESNQLASQLTRDGVRAYALLGGMKAWYNARLPIVKEANHG